MQTNIHSYCYNKLIFTTCLMGVWAMQAQALSLALHISQRQDSLLHALEVVLREVEGWQTARRHVRAQLISDFQLSSLTQDEVCTILEDYGVWAVALRQIADHLEREVDDTTNDFYDWLYD